MSRANIPSVVVVAAIAAFDFANAKPGTLVFDTGANTAWTVRLNGTVRSLLQIGTGGTPGGNTRTLGVVVTPGALASGDVTYTATVLNGDGVPVPLALVFIGVRRTVGVGALTTLVGTGIDISNVENNAADGLAIVGQCDAAGVFSFVLSGTAGDTVDTAIAIDAASGGSQSLDGGRVLP